MMWSIFSYAHLLSVYLSWSVCYDLWPIFKLYYFLIVELSENFACFGEQSFIKCVFFKCFLLVCGLAFHSFHIVFHRAKVFFCFNKVEFILCFIDLVNVLYKKSSSYPSSSRFFLICFLGVLNLYFTFKPAIYLELIL